MNLFIPREICHHILSYVQNIEIRMHYGIINKIDIDTYSNKLNTYLRNKGVHWGNHTRYFCIKNIEYENYTSNQYVNTINDFVDIKCDYTNENYVSIHIYVWKMKKRLHNYIDPFVSNESNAQTNSCYLQSFDDTYYWYMKEIKYQIR